MRNKLLTAGERERNIACDINDISWFEEIDASDGVVFFSLWGVFYDIFGTEQVKRLVRAMSNMFGGGRMVFDAAGKTAVKMIAKTWLKESKIKDVGAYFSVSNAKKELSLWSRDMSISSRGYMLGYGDLKNAPVGRFFRFLANVGDNVMKMQIVRLDFGGAK